MQRLTVGDSCRTARPSSILESLIPFRQSRPGRTDRTAAPGARLPLGRAVRGLPLLVLAAAVAACGERTTLGPEAGPSAVSFDLEPDTVEGWTGDTVRMDATVEDEAGRPVAGYEVTWSSSDTSVATVDGDGLVTFGDSGSSTITATASSGSGSTKLTGSGQSKSKGGRAESVTVSPDSSSVAVGDSVQLEAGVTGPDGTALDKNVVWTSLSPEVAAVDEDGTVTGRAAGTARIEAKAGGARDTGTVVVEGDGSAPSDTTSAPSDTTSAPSDTTSTDTTTSVPEMPASVSVAETGRTDTSVTYEASWSAVDSADSYDWQAGSNGGMWSDGGAAAGTTATITAPRSSADDSSYACVQAVNEAGASESACDGFAVPAAPSDTASAPSDTTSSDSTATAPAPPTGVSVSETGRTDSTITYRLSWDTVEAASGYDWRAGPDSGGGWTESGSTAGAGADFTAPRTDADRSSYACVQATNDAGASESACVGFTVSAAPSTVTVPAAPSGLSASASTTSRIDGSFTDNSGDETGFRVYRDDGSGWVLAQELAAGITSFSDTGLAEGTTYRYEVTAFNSAGESARSNTASATTESSTSDPSPSSGLWIGGSELASLPTSGAAWESLKSEADGSCGTLDLSDQEQDHNVCVMAKALVYARTGRTTYRAEVVTALESVVGMGTYDGRALALGRELAAYVIAADLIDLSGLNATLDGAFRDKLRELLTTYTHSGPDDLVACHEDRPNNWGTHCGASRAAVAAYLGDEAELDRVARVFRGWLGERSAYAGFSYGDLDWQCDPDRPVGINPAGCTIEGHPVGGVLPDDQRRAGAFTWPPSKENYVWEGLQGALVQAVILERQGYDAFQWGDRALLRAVRWLHEQADYPAEGDDTWQPHVVNDAYGTSFPAPVPSSPGKNVGWTDWTHQ